MVKENIKFGEKGKRLDLFFPQRGEEGGSQVIVYVGGGNWRWWKKSWGSLTGNRLGRMGYLVVVPEVVQWPDGKVGDMVCPFFGSYCRRS